MGNCCRGGGDNSGDEAPQIINTGHMTNTAYHKPNPYPPQPQEERQNLSDSLSPKKKKVCEGFILEDPSNSFPDPQDHNIKNSLSGSEGKSRIISEATKTSSDSVSEAASQETRSNPGTADKINNRSNSGIGKKTQDPRGTNDTDDNFTRSKPRPSPPSPDIVSPKKSKDRARQPRQASLGGHDQEPSEASSSETVLFKEGLDDRDKKSSGVAEKQSSPRVRPTTDTNHNSNQSKHKASFVASEGALIPPLTTSEKTTTPMKPLEDSYKVEEVEPSHWGQANMDVEKRRNRGAERPTPSPAKHDKKSLGSSSENTLEARIPQWGKSNVKTEQDGHPNGPVTTSSTSPIKGDSTNNRDPIRQEKY